MSPTNRIAVAAFTLAALSTAALAQNYDLSWHKIAGGGGDSSGGSFTLSGTIGQHDAQPPPVMSGGAFTLTGGFWPGASASACTLPGDMNHDGHIDGDDIQLFINCLLAGTGQCACADLDGGGLGPTDIPAFVAALLTQ